MCQQKPLKCVSCDLFFFFKAVTDRRLMAYVWIRDSCQSLSLWLIKQRIVSLLLVCVCVYMLYLKCFHCRLLHNQTLNTCEPLSNCISHFCFSHWLPRKQPSCLVFCEHPVGSLLEFAPQAGSVKKMGCNYNYFFPRIICLFFK